MKVFIFFFSLCFLAVADEKTVLLAKIKHDILLQDGAHLIEEKGHTFLVAVGNSKIKDKSIEAKLHAIKGSQVKAQKAIMVFIHGSEISVTEKLIRKTLTEQTEEGKDIQVKKTRTSTRERQIQEKSDGVLASMKTLGTWREKERYFSAYYFELMN